ncbi:MAG: DUF2306 domain-containing protein [Gammaproteobacteria bacterium]|nr:DUF2306 domain-containing protein [Gammaproteobacteria bacterium]
MKKVYLSGFIFMVLLGLFATAGHYLAPRPTAEMLATMSVAPGVEWFTEQLPRYAQHPVMTALHIVPSFLFMLLILVQLSPRVRERALPTHRWLGRLFVLMSVVIGVSGLLLGIIMPFGGLFETVVIVVVGLAFLAVLAMGVIRIRQGRIAEHRYWMLHMVALAFVPVTMRILLNLGMFTTELSGPSLFGPTMLLGTVINLWVLHGFVLRGRVGLGTQTLPLGRA